MRLLIAVHQDDAGPGVFAEVAREDGVEVVEWRPQNGSPPDGADAVLVLGASANPDQEAEHAWIPSERDWVRELIARGVPTLGVCFGAELVGEAGGGRALRLPVAEIGWHEVSLSQAAASDPLLGALPERFASLQWHSYAVEPPPSATLLASSAASAQAYRLAERAWGIQFHAEVTPEIVEGWIVEAEQTDPADVEEASVDLDAFRARTAAEIERWMALGRGLFARFLDVARRDS